MKAIGDETPLRNEAEDERAMSPRSQAEMPEMTLADGIDFVYILGNFKFTGNVEAASGNGSAWETENESSPGELEESSSASSEAEAAMLGVAADQEYGRYIVYFKLVESGAITYVRRTSIMDSAYRYFKFYDSHSSFYIR